jgi:2-phosphosulfolactate phosphatase
MVIIDVFRVFTTAAVALSRSARRIMMVDSLNKALALRSSGVGDHPPRAGSYGRLPRE